MIAKAAFLATALVAVLAVAVLHVTIPGPSQWPWWLVALAVPVLYRFPMTISQGARTIEVGFESVVVIFLSFAAPDLALALWAGGWLLAQVPLPWGRSLQRTSPWISLVNVAMTALSGVAAILVITRGVPGALDGGWPALLAVLLAAGAYVSVDYVLSAVALTLLGRGTMSEAWSYDGLSLALLSAAAVGVLGYLGAVAAAADPWTAPLIGVPVVTFVMAARGFTQASIERGRVQALLAVASGLHQATSPADVEQVVTEEGPAALAADALHLADRPTAAGIHERLEVPGGDRWLVAPVRRNHMPYQEEDRRALAVLAELAGSTLSRLALLVEMEALAARDPLTGLSNRATLGRALASALGEERAGSERRRPAGAGSTALLFCDLDGFKGVNDDHGHETGDLLLQRVADCLRACVRDGDLVARMGGDEFVALLPGATIEDAMAVADRISGAISQLSLPSPEGVGVGMSIGVAVTGPSSTAEDLLREADAAMYRAKAGGRNRVRIGGATAHS